MTVPPIQQQTDPAHKLLLSIISYCDGPTAL